MLYRSVVDAVAFTVALLVTFSSAQAFDESPAKSMEDRPMGRLRAHIVHGAAA